MAKDRFEELLDKIESGERNYYPSSMVGSKQERGTAPNGGREIAFKNPTQSGRHPGVWDRATVTPASVTAVGETPLDQLNGPALFVRVVGVEEGPTLTLVEDPSTGDTAAI
ncbi:hypothetical protein [Gordonia sp. MMO-8]|uniref:hypothetical protein n=1 Tax=Gordonia sp. MMO-8 TaxID=3127886 RepID=UPI003016112D